MIFWRMFKRTKSNLWKAIPGIPRRSLHYGRTMFGSCGSCPRISPPLHNTKHSPFLVRRLRSAHGIPHDSDDPQAERTDGSDDAAVGNHAHDDVHKPAMGIATEYYFPRVICSSLRPGEHPRRVLLCGVRTIRSAYDGKSIMRCTRLFRCPCSSRVIPSPLQCPSHPPPVAHLGGMHERYRLRRLPTGT